MLFCDIVRVGKNSYCEFDKFEFNEVNNCEILSENVRIKMDIRIEALTEKYKDQLYEYECEKRRSGRSAAF